MHPLLIFKPCYLLALRHRPAPTIHVHPSSLGLPPWGGHMPHLTPTRLPCAQSSTQDQTPTCKGICVLIPPIPKVKTWRSSQHIGLQTCLLYPTQRWHTPCFLRVQISCQYLKSAVFTLKSLASLQLSGLIPTWQ